MIELKKNKMIKKFYLALGNEQFTHLKIIQNTYTKLWDIISISTRVMQ